MKCIKNVFRVLVGFAIGAGACAAFAQVPVGTAFTYQGELVLDGNIVNEPCDFEFRLFDDSVAGAQIGVTQTLNAEPVTGGRFTVLLDFDAQFQGQARWLEVAVRCPAGVGAFTSLTPRQEMTPAPYAMGLSLPFLGITDANLGGAFEIVNNDFGWAGVFRNNNPANTDAALNVTSMGGPAGYFWNDAGGTTLIANNPTSGTGVYSEIQGTVADSSAIHGLITNANAGNDSAAVLGENKALVPATIGVWGTSAGSGHGVRGTSLSGHGVHGESIDDFGFGVYGTANGRNGIGVYGIHPGANGDSPGVDGVTNSIEGQAAGVRGRATAQTTVGTTYGVLGQSSAIAGVGVRGESYTGAEGAGQRHGVLGTASDIIGEGVRGEATYGVWGLGDNGGAGVVGEAGNGSTYGVHAIGAGGRLDEPALRADNGNGPGIYSLAARAIEGEGDEFGVRGVTWDENGYGGTFTNYDANGVALHVSGRAEVIGTMQVNVLEIMGGADLAERFAFSETAEPGMVVAIDPDQPGQMRISREAYNTRVAGVISGANELAAGVVLGDAPGHEHNLPIALSGRVWVKCDTRAAAVQPGDFLTTSDLAGFAMPVIDRDRASGAIIGKAMTALGQGEDGMVLVLVNLQ